MKRHFAVLVAIASIAGSAAAAESSAAKKAADARYAEDKQLCAEESSSSARMQCLRDAKAEYTKALAAAKNATGAASTGKRCDGCGKVLSVRVVEKEGESSPLGMVAGGVAGALLGHQVGGGRGKDIATIAGAAGGAYAGHKIEQKVKSSKVWEVAVRFDNGDEKTYAFDKDPGLAAGDGVKANGESVVRR
ncbi:MAG: glycine zipper 2TM domain-containing protein [Rhodocyclaceae bacterium]|jgi:outer membrane lipoprotein SlyB|nr:glycine zipper 2TM domain-containing protein [Rhodocyclaceae bacterium]